VSLVEILAGIVLIAWVLYDVFNTVTSIFYFVFLFDSSMFYPIDPLPAAFRAVALANPITWHVDVMRFATIGLGDPRRIALEAAGFIVFTLVSFGGAMAALRRAGSTISSRVLSAPR